MDYRALVQKLGDRTNQNTQTSELILEHRTGHPNKLLKTFLGLSKSYGTAKAEIINEDGHAEKINTNDHPKTEFVDISQNPARDLQTMVENIAQNSD